MKHRMQLTVVSHYEIDDDHLDDYYATDSLLEAVELDRQALIGDPENILFYLDGEHEITIREV